MEKISFFDLMTILLPGALFTILLQIVLKDTGISFGDFEANAYYSLTIFLSSSIFMGSLINIITWKLINFYQWIRLHSPLVKIFNKSNNLLATKPFYSKLLNEIFEKNGKVQIKNTFTPQEIERLWDEVYYDLEVNKNNNIPKNYQSFYFFFRNFFTISLLATVLLTIAHFLYNIDIKYTLFLVISLFVLIVSHFAARWNRKKMVQQMFWIYFILHKNSKS